MLLWLARMKTLRAWATALTLTFAVSSPTPALVNLPNLTTGAGGLGTFTLPPLTIPSSFKIEYRVLQSGAGPLSNVGLSWTDTSQQDVSTTVERSTNGTTWTTRTTFSTPLAGPQTYADTGLQPDTKYCYRVTSRGPKGEFVQTSPRCVLTQTPGDPGVWRTELRVRVANVPDAGTDRWVSVALTLPVNDLPGGNWTGINYAIDDFEMGSDMTYDLSQTGITTLHDISRISLAISHWDDAVCLRDLQLLVNGQVAFEKVWGNMPGTCRWLGGSNGPQSLLIDKAALRAHPAFSGFVNPRSSLTIAPDELESRTESMIGSLLFLSDDLAWRSVDGGYGVEVSKKAGVENTIHVKLPLEGLVDDFFNPDVNVEFDLRPSFVPIGTQSDFQLEVAGWTANVDYAWWLEKLTGVLEPLCIGLTFAEYAADYPSFPSASAIRCFDRLVSHVRGIVLQGFSLSSKRLALALPASCQQPTVTVTANGGLQFGCQAAQQKPRVGATATSRLTAISR
jgi:hypothetical protein